MCGLFNNKHASVNKFVRSVTFITYMQYLNSSHAEYSIVSNVHYNQNDIIFTSLPVTPDYNIDLHAYNIMTFTTEKYHCIHY